MVSEKDLEKIVGNFFASKTDAELAAILDKAKMAVADTVNEEDFFAQFSIKIPPPTSFVGLKIKYPPNWSEKRFPPIKNTVWARFDELVKSNQAYAAEPEKVSINCTVNYTVSESEALPLAA